MDNRILNNITFALLIAQAQEKFSFSIRKEEGKVVKFGVFN